MRRSHALVFCSCIFFLAVGAMAAEQSGFLDDYSILRPRDPNKPGEPDLMYIKYGTDDPKWASYTRILLEPVQVWKGKGTALYPEHAEYLAKHLWSRLDEELSKDYKMTSQPGPGVLRIQVAITKPGENDAQMGDIKTSLPQGTRLIYEKHDWFPSTEAFVDKEVAAEMKVSDAETGELLGAGVDKRSGGKYADKVLTNWADAAEVGTFWAKRIRWRFCVLRGGSDCEEIRP